MRVDRWASAGAALLGLLMIANGLLGPVGADAVGFHISDPMKHQLFGGEVVSLFVAGPLAVAAGAIWWRRHRLGPALAAAPSAYALYTYVQFVVGPEYGRYPGNHEFLFPLYLALVILGWGVLLRAWSALGAGPITPPPPGARRLVLGVLGTLSTLFVLAWAASIVAVLRGIAAGAPPAEYALDPQLFWLIRLMDLGFVIPSAVITVAGLWRRAPWAPRLAVVVTGLHVLLTSAVAGMAIMMALRRDPATNMVLLVATTISAALLTAAYVGLLRVVGDPAATHQVDRRATPADSPHRAAWYTLFAIFHWPSTWSSTK